MAGAVNRARPRRFRARLPWPSRRGTRPGRTARPACGTRPSRAFSPAPSSSALARS
ncbi:MAG: hypothetical protein MZU95_07255 [Desulfomicrobium escambiense]|nr:hypothetical protein [Desulfomicrobium escambiense]